jgi:hypothetical protein
MLTVDHSRLSIHNNKGAFIEDIRDEKDESWKEVCTAESFHGQPDQRTK